MTIHLVAVSGGRARVIVRGETVDDLLARARRSTDDVELKSLYSAAQKRLNEIVPGIPLDENHSNVAYDRALHGLLFDTSHNTPVITAAWLEAGR